MLAIIQVAIGLIFVYSLLSILATTINSVITNLMQLRAEYLRRGLVDLLTDPEIQVQFLSHPLIRVVETPMVTPEETDNPAEARAMAAHVSKADITNVNWIDPKTFAQVLTSLLTEKADISLYGPLLVAINRLPESAQKYHLLDLAFGLQNAGFGLNELRAAILALPATQQAPLLETLKPIEDRMAEANLNESEAGRLLPVLEGLRRINDDAFRRALKVVVASAQSYDEAQANLENWFNDRMDQVTELYKGRLVFFSLIIGSVLTLALNADSLHMAQALWSDPALRETIVSAAEGAVASGSLQDQINRLQTPTPAPTLTMTPIPEAAVTQEAQVLIPLQAESTPAAPAPTTAELAQAFQETLNDLLTLNLPIGWEYTPVEGGCYVTENRPVACDSMRNIWLLAPNNNPNWLGLIVRKLIGGIVTVIAIAQGAPFWFDLLRRLVKG